ncbi:DUF4115 domain-containing protein [Vibrio sp. FNV 38]|nr:DUF4115 domain-containing protein [Vibrio sp. FNV 38]
MTNEETSVADTQQIQAGTLLQAKRQELGLSQQQVAERLCLKITVIKNLENNDFSGQQVTTFTRGYIRNYAKLVGIPDAEILCALNGCDSTQRKEQEMHSFSKKTNKERHDSRIMLITWGVLITIVGISVLWWFNERDNRELDLVQDLTPDSTVVEVTETLPAIEDVVVQEIDVQENNETLPTQLPEEGQSVPSSQEATQLLTSNEQVTAEAIVDELLDEAQEAESSAIIEPAALPRLRVTLDGDCWLQVKDSTGKTLAIGTKNAGEVLDFDQEGSYSLVLGAPQNVSITFASEPVDLSGYTAGKVARITLP